MLLQSYYDAKSYFDFSGEKASGQADMAFEDARETLAFKQSRRSEMHCARNIGGAIFVLATGIAEINLSVVDRSVRFNRGFVVHDGSVRSWWTDRVETDAHKIRLLLTESGQFIRRRQFRDILFGRNFRLQPREKTAQSCRIFDVGIGHS